MAGITGSRKTADNSSSRRWFERFVFWRDWLTGDEVWSSKDFEKGTLTIAGDKMICLTEDKGVVALAEVSPKGWKEISRFVLTPQSERRAPKTKVWTPPVIAHGRLYLRDQKNLCCFQIASETSTSTRNDARNPKTEARREESSK